MRKTHDIPIIEEKSKAELDAIICIIQESSLPVHAKEFIIKCIESALWFPHILQRKNISLNRLREMLFGKGHKSKKEETAKNTGNTATMAKQETSIEAPAAATVTETIEATVNPPALETQETAEAKEKKPGHGRMSHTAYEASHEITLKAAAAVGDMCPCNCGGKLYAFNPNKPRVLIRIKGQNFAAVYKYTVEQLRCNLCDHLIQADIPAEVGEDKYDASFKSWVAIQKYFVAVPFYRQETFQKMLGFPLPDSTQWDLVEQMASSCYSVFNALKIYAANGERIHNDDTTLRIQEIIQSIKNNPECKRKGMFTTGFIADHEGHRIALFINGTQHAGENLDDVLMRRDKEKPPIIQMCDALSCNIAKGVETILANCLSHGFRKFQDIMDYFPVPCMTIMKLLSHVYDEDEKTKNMSDTDRLLHHQQHSKPMMELLQKYMQALFDEKLVEPNSELGKAIKYMQKHWYKLTRFLIVKGTPLCNNIVERALKIAIRNRKSAFFYRTVYSAGIGGMLTSLIYTCYLAKENPHDYLTALQEHSSLVLKNPPVFLPWNYKDTLKQRGPPEIQATAANVAASLPAQVDLAAG